MSSRKVVLESKDLVAGYLPGVDILTGCNFKLHQGELVGIIGPNGAGKSTLVRVCSVPSRGTKWCGPVTQ